MLIVRQAGRIVREPVSQFCESILWDKKVLAANTVGRFMSDERELE